MDVPSTAKLVLLKLADHARDDGTGVYPSQKSVAEECGLSDRSVRNVIADAIEWGILVEVPTPGNRANEYRFVMAEVEGRSRWKDVPGGISRPSRWNHVPASRNDVPAINKKHPLTIKNHRETRATKKRVQREATPASAEACAEYAKEIGMPLSEAKKFWYHFEANGWKVGGRTPMKDWRAALNKWRLNLEPDTGAARKRPPRMDT
jgi:hypothetical protein